jgi:hypothetical protein
MATMARSPCPGYSKMTHRTAMTDLRPIQPISEAREHEIQFSDTPRLFHLFINPHHISISHIHNFQETPNAAVPLPRTKTEILILQDLAQAQSSWNFSPQLLPSLVQPRINTKQLQRHKNAPPRSVSFLPSFTADCLQINGQCIILTRMATMPQH